MATPNGDIKLANNFELASAKPIDSRFIVNSLTDLQAITFPYVGLLVFVLDTQTYWFLKSLSPKVWVQQGKVISAGVSSDGFPLIKSSSSSETTILKRIKPNSSRITIAESLSGDSLLLGFDESGLQETNNLIYLQWDDEISAVNVQGQINSILGNYNEFPRQMNGYLNKNISLSIKIHGLLNLDETYAPWGFDLFIGTRQVGVIHCGTIPNSSTEYYFNNQQVQFSSLPYSGVVPFSSTAQLTLGLNGWRTNASTTVGNNYTFNTHNCLFPVVNYDSYLFEISYFNENQRNNLITINYCQILKV